MRISYKDTDNTKNSLFVLFKSSDVRCILFVKETNLLQIFKSDLSHQPDAPAANNTCNICNSHNHSTIYRIYNSKYIGKFALNSRQ